MVTANNGILIVALFFGLGVYLHDSALLAYSLGLAGLSYLVNVSRDMDRNDIADSLFWIVFVLGLGVFVYALMRLVGWL